MTATTAWGTPHAQSKKLPHLGDGEQDDHGLPPPVNRRPKAIDADDFSLYTRGIMTSETRRSTRGTDNLADASSPTTRPPASCSESHVSR